MAAVQVLSAALGTAPPTGQVLNHAHVRSPKSTERVGAASEQGSALPRLLGLRSARTN